jgi:hypothetical protein
LVEKWALIGDDGTEAKITLTLESARSHQPQLSAEQEAQAQRIFDVLKRTADDGLLALARLLASKKDRDLLGQTEFEVRDRVHQIGAKAIQTALNERKRGYQGSSVICSACQQLARFQRWQSKNFLSVLGEVRLERAYYYCRHCGQGHHPWEEMLGLTSQDLTPAASELTSLAGLLCSFEEASRKVLPKLAGLRLSESTAERTTEAVGQRLAQRWAAGDTLGGFRPWPWSTDSTGQSCAYVSVDATGVGQQGPKGAKADGRMAYVGMVFNAHDDKPSQARYLAGLYALEELGPQLRRQAGQVGMNQAQQWIALSDGGAGLEEFMQCYFPGAVCILDFFHAAQHLHELAKLWQGGDEEQGKQLGQQWSHCLKHEGGPALLAVLEELDLGGRGAALREKYRQVTQ